ncbi:hypothetical protein [Streptomyces sp. NPDC056191]|uniref:hypothetical protein n=1 Tax=Streptomyces sp. NPDC056191 TaxID=3345742 RepID=UPI0035DD6E15
MKDPSGSIPATKGCSPTGTSPTVPAPRTSTTDPTKAPAGTTPATKTEKTPGTAPGKATAPDTKATPDKASGSSAKTIPIKNGGTPPTPTTPPTTPEPLFTRSSRETGYRDGTRVARAAAKGRAYGHGVQDGWHAVMSTADQEKAVLDQARYTRATRKDPVMPPSPAVPPRPTHAPAATTPAPTPTSPATPTDARSPIQVTGIDKTHIHLGDGATRDSVTRGEIRSFKGFERRLEARRNDIGRVAEDTQHLAQHAIEQAKQITQLQEQAKAVKGGDKVLATLTRLQETVNIQVQRAEDLHRRAVRSNDLAGSVLANVAMRYGGIYQAVVDSPETAPAEHTFYKG